MFAVDRFPANVDCDWRWDEHDIACWTWGDHFQVGAVNDTFRIFDRTVCMCQFGGDGLEFLIYRIDLSDEFGSELVLLCACADGCFAIRDPVFTEPGGKGWHYGMVRRIWRIDGTGGEVRDEVVELGRK